MVDKKGTSTSVTHMLSSPFQPFIFFILAAVGISVPSKLKFLFPSPFFEHVYDRS